MYAARVAVAKSKQRSAGHVNVASFRAFAALDKKLLTSPFTSCRIWNITVVEKIEILESDVVLALRCSKSHLKSSQRFRNFPTTLERNSQKEINFVLKLIAESLLQRVVQHRLNSVAQSSDLGGNRKQLWAIKAQGAIVTVDESFPRRSCVKLSKKEKKGRRICLTLFSEWRKSQQAGKRGRASFDRTDDVLCVRALFLGRSEVNVGRDKIFLKFKILYKLTHCWCQLLEVLSYVV